MSTPDLDLVLSYKIKFGRFLLTLPASACEFAELRGLLHSFWLSSTGSSCKIVHWGLLRQVFLIVPRVNLSTYFNVEMGGRALFHEDFHGASCCLLGFDTWLSWLA